MTDDELRIESARLAGLSTTLDLYEWHPLKDMNHAWQLWEYAKRSSRFAEFLGNLTRSGYAWEAEDFLNLGSRSITEAFVETFGEDS